MHLPWAPAFTGATIRELARLDYSLRRGDEWGACQVNRIVGLGLASLLLAPAGVAAQQGAARQACGADIKQLCAEVRPGEGRITACVEEHFGQLSGPCQIALIGSVTITKACREDYRQKCAGVEPGGGRSQACLKDHFGELAEHCKEALLLGKLQRQ
jgi:Cysteine rich repeat